MIIEAVPKSSVWSSLALAKAAPPTIASAPGLFSTTTGLPQRFASPSANSRALISLAEPAENGTISLTLRVGQLSLPNEGDTMPAEAATRIASASAFRRKDDRKCMAALLQDAIRFNMPALMPATPCPNDAARRKYITIIA
ncbi:hypothetical protein GGD65_006894 [Bradyrhizobium sp. CIR18]|uniref:hypothetical protein n=1 Tax=Bradyrhizobium sp. CIR18 TaxID=2663839 RepID=UPI00180D9295|nr:hypothetical protein [Bradyrhizobium sp. CIR18]MBB4365825.1 hypothetical protein [Bradyrhizobium sp. CIR18]